jgi:hypothetical protein
MLVPMHFQTVPRGPAPKRAAMQSFEHLPGARWQGRVGSNNPEGNGCKGDVQPASRKAAGEVPGPLCSRYQASGAQQADHRHHEVGCPEDRGASGQRDNRDEEGVDQSKEGASGQSSAPLPGLRVRIVGVDDRHGHDQQAEDGSRCTRARSEEHFVVAQQQRNLTSITRLHASTTSLSDGSRRFTKSSTAPAYGPPTSASSQPIAAGDT